LSLKFTFCDNKDKWDCFVNLSPQGNIFCKTAFLDALEEDYDMVLVEENNQWKMGAIILKKDNEPLKAPYPFTMYQGVLIDNSIYNIPSHRWVKRVLEIMEYLLTNLQKYYKRISFCLHYNVDDLRCFQWFNYHSPERGQFLITLRYTGILNFINWSSFDQYLLNIRSVRRQEYKKAKSSNFILESSNDIDTLDQLHRKTFERQGIERNMGEARLLRLITSSALSKGYGQLLICKSADGIALSATVFLYDERCGYYMFAANDPEYRRTGSGTYLMLENIRRCWGKGLLKVDMVGINSPGRGDFKTSFNAVPVPYFIVHWERPA
jgi:GNAT superfamily N-acetyltransferase